jgi:putative thioredoxin
VLEKLAQAYGGQFLLAKLNTDEAPQISAALQIRSIPLVVLFFGGRPVDQFTGALPEGQIRAFLDKHLKPPVSPVDQLREEAARHRTTPVPKPCCVKRWPSNPATAKPRWTWPSG